MRPPLVSCPRPYRAVSGLRVLCEKSERSKSEQKNDDGKSLHGSSNTAQKVRFPETDMYTGIPARKEAPVLMEPLFATFASQSFLASQGLESPPCPARSTATKPATSNSPRTIASPADQTIPKGCTYNSHWTKSAKPSSATSLSASATPDLPATATAASSPPSSTTPWAR